ncbi:MAG: hypothetical protein A2Z99_11465 [Treponema sp. GWB1_62_6]|nr:MAG: hypothetical protein A2Z99_11465 [Treponema sp. GWB1_62_6]HCM24946.1 cyclic nucleotide-binding protein [Treponema sp.]
MIDFASFQKYSLFGGFSYDDIERIRPLIRIDAYSAGDFIIRENESNETIYFLLEGDVRISRDSVTIIDMSAGDCFGEMEILDVMPAAASVRALDPVTVAAIDNQALHRMYGLDPRLFALFMMNLARDLSRLLRRMDERFCEKVRVARCGEDLPAAV